MIYLKVYLLCYVCEGGIIGVLVQEIKKRGEHVNAITRNGTKKKRNSHGDQGIKR